MKSVFIIAIVTIGIIIVMIPSAFGLNTMQDDGKPAGHIPVLDDKIVIVNHNGLDYLHDSLEWHYSDSIIYGDIVNVSDDTLYYVIIRGNVYDNGKLLEDTGYMQPYVFRYDFPLEDNENIALAISPYKATIKPGESAQFSLWPGQVGWDCYEVWIESYESENKFKGISEERLRSDLVIKSVTDERGTLKGKVHNPNEYSLDQTSVIVAKYDQNEKIFAILGDDTGHIEPNKSKSFEIPLYLEAFPIKSHGDNFTYGVPASYEISAWGYTPWIPGGGSGVFADPENLREFGKNPIKYMAESKFFPNKDIVSGINFDNVIKTKSERVTSSCLTDPDQEFVTNTFKHQLPDWIKNNAGWWADGSIGEKEFLSALDYLLSNEILRINIPREELHMELDSQTYYVTKYNSDKMKLSGWYEGDLQDVIRCDLWEPNEVYPTKINITREGSTRISEYAPGANTGNFEENILLNLDWDEGNYVLECKHRSKHLATLSFDIIHGESPEIEKIIKSKVPSWIKNNAGWWANGTITEDTYMNGLEYLVQNGIIDAGKYNSKILEN